MYRKLALTLSAVALCLAPSMASAAAFNDETAHLWTRRVDGIVSNILDGAGTRSMKRAMAEGCDGLTSYTMTHGRNTSPWANAALATYCKGTDIMPDNGFSKPACSLFKTAISHLGKANPEKDPAEVVRAAGEFRVVLSTFLAKAKEARQC